MDWIYPLILAGAGLILVATLTSVLSLRFGAPLLLVFLGVGLLAGEDGLGLRFDDPNVAYLLGSLALAVIPYHLRVRNGMSCGPRGRCVISQRA